MLLKAKIFVHLSGYEQADICSSLWRRCWELGALTLHTCVVGYCSTGSQQFCFVTVEEEGLQSFWYLRSLISLHISGVVRGVLREREQLHSHISLTVPPNY